MIIEPFTTIAADVEIGSGTWIGPNVTIMDGARIGKDCRIFPGAVISSVPQDLKYRGEKTTCVIGDRTTIHEGVTVSRGTQAAGTTRVGDDCLLMAYVHVAHDCILGNHVILANYVGLTGHCQVDDYAIIGGLAGTHQFTKIGAHAMIAGGTLIRKDVPPYTKAAKEPISYIGVNSIGLHRRGFTSEKVDEIACFTRAGTTFPRHWRSSNKPFLPPKNGTRSSVSSASRSAASCADTPGAPIRTPKKNKQNFITHTDSS